MYTIYNGLHLQSNNIYSGLYIQSDNACTNQFSINLIKIAVNAYMIDAA